MSEVTVIEQQGTNVVQILTAGPQGPQGIQGTKGDVGDVTPAVTAAKVAAEAAAVLADSSKTTAVAASSTATTKATEAAASAVTAVNNATTATTKATEALASATAAVGSATTASTKASEALASAAQALTYKNTAETNSTSAGTSASTASTKAAEASASTTSAQTAATTANTKASEAATSASTAATSASNAATSATAAAGSASTASTQATNASASATAAGTSATNAAGSASSAAASAVTATSSKDSAVSSAGTATTKANEASTSATAAATSATNAGNSATAAATSASTATTKASEASTSATTATTAATTATTKATEATTSASNAATSATNAAGSVSAVAASAATATTQAGIATTKAGEAATSASGASTSASTATTKAAEAVTSATAAATAKTAAETARDQTLAAFDSFDDRYLGQKASDPTLDNDGNALVSGSLYFNTAPIGSGGGMKVYDGLVWLIAYASLSGALLNANNLSDLSSFSAARTNLSIGNVENKSSATIRGEITSANVTTALSFTPYNATNPNGYITGSGSITGNAATATLLSVGADRTKLDGIATGANNYAHPANHPASIITQDASNRFVTDAEKATWNGKQAAGNYATGGGTATGTNTGDQVLPTTLPASDVYAWAKAATKPSYTAIEVGLGNVPNLAFSGSNTGDETTATIKTKLGVTTLSGSNTGDQTTITGNAGSATTLSAGADRTKLDGIAASANNYTHPVNHPASIITQDASNRFVTDTEKATWNAKQPAGTYATGGGTATGTNTGDQVIPTTLPASDVYAWAKAATKPTYTAAEVGAPSLTGTGASGSWGIDITGIAANLANFANRNNGNGFTTPDSLTFNGFSYTTGTTLWGQTDGALYAQAGASEWVHQIIGDYYTGQIAVRAKTNNVWGSWRQVLDSQNVSTYAITPTSTQTLTNKTLTDPTLADSSLTQAMLKDTGFTYFNSGTTNALNYVNGSNQRWAPATGAQTLSISNWPPTGNLGELLIEGVNLGAATITWPTINWVKSDGTFTTTFSANGVTLQSAGTDFVYLWTRDAGTTIYGKVTR